MHPRHHVPTCSFLGADESESEEEGVAEAERAMEAGHWRRGAERTGGAAPTAGKRAIPPGESSDGEDVAAGDGRRGSSADAYGRGAPPSARGREGGTQEVGDEADEWSPPSGEGSCRTQREEQGRGREDILRPRADWTPECQADGACQPGKNGKFKSKTSLMW